MSGGFSEAMKDINLSEDSAENSEISEYEDIEIIDGFYLENGVQFLWNIGWLLQTNKETRGRLIFST